MPFRDRPPTGLQRMTTRQVIPENISEAAFQSYVVEAAAWHGWKTFHPRTVRTFKGNHLTAYQGDAVGQSQPGASFMNARRGSL